MALIIRGVEQSDETALLALAPRLMEGVAPWRPPHAVLDAVVGWVKSAIDNQGNEDHMVLVADRDGSVAGFVSVSEKKHWTGQTDAYIGELVVATDHEGHGVGSALVGAAIDWSRERGLERVTLDTGIRNDRARRLYESLGFEEEGISLCALIRPI